MVTEIGPFQGEHRFLSNFYAEPFVWRGEVWATSEHAYQAAKCVRREDVEIIRADPKPGAAKRQGRRVEIRADWEDVKVAFMHEIVTAKFAPGTSLAAALLATGDALLVEHNTWGDRFWGVCKGEGRNMLGVILMDVRRSLRARAFSPA